VITKYKQVYFKLREHKKAFFIALALIVLIFLFFSFIGLKSSVITGFFVFDKENKNINLDEFKDNFSETNESFLNSSDLTDDLNFSNLTASFNANQDEFILNDSVNDSGQTIVSGGRGGGGSSSQIIFPEDKEFAISIISPFRNTGTYARNVSFYYRVDGKNEIDFCNLFINKELINFSGNIVKGEIYDFFVEDLNPGKYLWEISCTDVLGNISFSSSNSVLIFESLSFLEASSLEGQDLERIQNFFVRKSGVGSINFLGSINLSDAINFSSYIFIGKNLIGIDSASAPFLNKPAVLTLFGLDFENPIILRDGSPCLDCEVLGYDGNLVFSVEHFSNYSASENSQLRIWDDTDEMVVNGGNISFYANYTNITFAEPILGASCNLNFEESSYALIYNAGSLLYEYEKEFSSPGVYDYNISCSADDFTSFTLLDYVSVGSSNRVNGASVVAISNSTADSGIAGSHAAVAGNLTELVVTGFTSTQSWQGYYGNVSGTIQLADGSNNVFYNWSQATAIGEVFASVESIDWNTIQCFDMLNLLSSLESKYNIFSNDVDGLDETFNLNDHSLFYVGNKLFNSGDCNNTKVFGPGGVGFFEEVLLMDNFNRTVFTSILKDNALGFDSVLHDFEMLVLEDGHGTDTSTTKYFFYLELG